MEFPILKPYGAKPEVDMAKKKLELCKTIIRI